MVQSSWDTGERMTRTDAPQLEVGEVVVVSKLVVDV